MFKEMIYQNETTASIILFLILFTSIQYFKPEFLYKKNGSIREFGVGYKNKTIMPVWLFSIILGIICYLSIMYYVYYY